MKQVEDLLTSAKTVHDRYAAARMERETVREWVLGLSNYPEPHGGHVREAIAWFKPLRDSMDPTEMKIADLARLEAIYRR
jgi:hypothetical protein